MSKSVVQGSRGKPPKYPPAAAGMVGDNLTDEPTKSFHVVGLKLGDKVAAKNLKTTESFAKSELRAGVALPGMSAAFLEHHDGSLPRPVGSIHTKSVLDHDDRIWISDATQEPYRWICYLALTSANGTPMLGTGWLIGPRTIVTAGHCIYNHDPKYGVGVMRSITAFAGRNINNSLGQSDVHSVETTQEWIDSENNTAFDFGVLYLDSPIGDDVGFFAFGNYSDADLSGMTINVVGYPADKKNGTMWGHVNKGASVRPQRIAYMNDTYGGQSGSPVIYWDGSGDFVSVGIHNYGIDPFDPIGRHNYATRINQSVFNQLQAWKK
jgi:glutamyl endopeptidase